MKSVGIIKGVDKMGRVVIPKEIRQKLDIKNDSDSFELFCEDDSVILKKYVPSCIFCDGNGELIKYSDKFICEGCIKKLSVMLEEKKINIELMKESEKNL